MFGKAAMEGEFPRSKEFNGLDFFANQPQQINGLSRFQSAPSSFIASLMDSAAENNSSSGDESESIFTAFMNHKVNDVDDGSQNIIQYRMKEESGIHDPDTLPGEGGYGHGQGQTGRVVGSGTAAAVGMERSQVISYGNGNGFSSGLVRQSSSPAGFFNGFGVTGPSPRFMPGIPENVMQDQSGSGNTANNGKVASSTYESWNINDNNSSTVMKRNRHGEIKMPSNFNGLDSQQYLKFQQDVVTCQIRAKRGCATHPRSIAERMRRTRISQKMKKLQDLFPNMDKQTNTADMLDLAVQYIKDLQKQVQTLSDTRSKCVCSNATR